MSWRRNNSLASRGEMAKVNRMLEVIKKEGMIHKYDLIGPAGVPMSISLFEKLKPLLLHYHRNKVKFDVKSAMFEYIACEWKEGTGLVEKDQTKLESSAS